MQNLAYYVGNNRKGYKKEKKSELLVLNVGSKGTKKGLNGKEEK